MRPLSFLMTFLLLPASCFAATLEQIVQVLAAPTQGSTTPGEWAQVAKLQGMKWQIAAPKQTPVGFTRYGTVRLERLGNVTVYFTGDRIGAQQASVSMPEGVDKREFTQTLQRLIPSAKIKQLRGGCKDDGEIGGSAVYQIDASGSAAVFAMMMSGTSRAGMDTELTIAKRLDKNWNCVS